MPTVETRLRQELRNNAVELRQLAYTLPNGVREHDLLLLSERMHAAADQVVRRGRSHHARLSRRGPRGVLDTSRCREEK